MAHSVVRYRNAESRDDSGTVLEPAGEWVEHPKQFKENCGIVRDLKPSGKYEFQVREVSESGTSEWSEYLFETVPSPLDWYQQYLLSEFESQLKAIVDALVERLLPNFEEISEEAQKAAEDAWNEHMSRPPATEFDDPADYAEQAENVGISRYILLSGIRQGMINLFAVALHHAFEQQIARFHTQQDLLHPCFVDCKGEVPPIEWFWREQLCKRIDVKSFKSWQKVNELRHVANTVKHAEGPSARKLRRIRPDIFEFPEPPIAQPLLGEDIEVSIEDISDYRDHLLMFWEEFSSSTSGKSVLLVLKLKLSV